MSRTIRFPLQQAVPSVGPAETSLIIDLGTFATIPKAGGLGLGVDVRAWKTIQRQTETPFSCVVIEWTADAEMVVGDGTFAQQIGLYGDIVTSTTNTRFLLGVLGLARGGVVPQVVIGNTGARLVGFAQVVSDVALYDALAIGGVTGAIPIVGGLVTITARPIRSREYMG